MKKLQLTQEEFDFLHVWLGDDLDLQLENNNIGRSSLNTLKSIVGKIKEESKNVNN